MTQGRWYGRPEGDGLVLRKSPRLASWNKATDHDQVQLRQYLKDTAELVAPAMVSGPWAILLDVGSGATSSTWPTWITTPCPWPRT